MIQPSCPALVVHGDDAFRKKLIATLDQQHFAVTFAGDGDEATDLIRARTFNVVILGLNLASGAGTKALEVLRDERASNVKCGVMILGDPDPRIRTCAPWADEMLLKPVDASYVATRARAYCGCP